MPETECPNLLARFRYDDDGTLVRIYRDATKVDEFYVRASSGIDPWALVPLGCTVRESSAS